MLGLLWFSAIIFVQEPKGGRAVPYFIFPQVCEGNYRHFSRIAELACEKQEQGSYKDKRRNISEYIVMLLVQKAMENNTNTMLNFCPKVHIHDTESLLITWVNVVNPVEAVNPIKTVNISRSSEFNKNSESSKSGESSKSSKSSNLSIYILMKL